MIIIGSIIAAFGSATGAQLWGEMIIAPIILVALTLAIIQVIADNFYKYDPMEVVPKLKNKVNKFNEVWQKYRAWINTIRSLLYYLIVLILILWTVNILIKVSALYSPIASPLVTNSMYNNQTLATCNTTVTLFCQKVILNQLYLTWILILVILIEVLTLLLLWC